MACGIINKRGHLYVGSISIIHNKDAEKMEKNYYPKSCHNLGKRFSATNIRELMP
jgi:hypothetical protein